MEENTITFEYKTSITSLELKKWMDFYQNRNIWRALEKKILLEVWCFRMKEVNIKHMDLGIAVCS